MHPPKLSILQGPKHILQVGEVSCNNLTKATSDRVEGQWQGVLWQLNMSELFVCIVTRCKIIQNGHESFVKSTLLDLEAQ